MVIENFENKIYAYALKNALIYKGKAQQGNVISALFNEGLKKNDVEKHIKKISEIVKEINSWNLEKQKEKFESLKELISERIVREGLPELPNVSEKGVVMRFAPSASGPLHIGHALTASISYLYVKKYGGNFYIRIEDTNPENIFPEAYKMIEEDSKWLFENNVEIKIQSDRIDLYYKYSEKLIKKNSAYVCICSQEEFKNYSQNKKNCPCRNLDVKDNLKRWKKMLDKSSEGYSVGEAILRFRTFDLKLGKSGMTHKNPAMRDFPLARINLTPHPRQKKKYKVWPLMNLAVATDDIEMGMTHIIRGKDHRDNAERQKMIYDALGVSEKFPWNAFLGRIKFKDLELSTTKMRQAIEDGIYKSWSDSKLPTLISLKKQGYKPESFWKFAEQIGLSENDKVMDKKEFFTLLNSFNKI